MKLLITAISIVLSVLVTVYIYLADKDEAARAVAPLSANTPVHALNSETLPNVKLYEILGALQGQLDSLQKQQTVLLGKYNSIVQSDNKEVVIQTDIDEEPIEVYDNFVSEEEQQLAYEANFDQHWTDNSYEDRDNDWADAMEYSFEQSQLQLEEDDLASTAITGIDCRASTCTVEFTHHNGFEEADNADYINNMMPEGASQFMLKQIHDGGIDKTLAIYMR